MLKPAKLIDVELTRRPLPVRIDGLNGYRKLRALVRVHGRPVGWAEVPIINDECPGLPECIVEQLGEQVLRQLCIEGLTHDQRPESWTLENLLGLPGSQPAADLPSLTVAVCTRDRPEALRLCLNALMDLDYRDLEVLVIDNAPSSDATGILVKNHFPRCHYIKETRPGLDWARNRAIHEARGELIAFADDDVVVDSMWASVIGSTFAEQPALMALTGLVVPLELETRAQELFEIHGGFGKGFSRRWFRGGSRGSQLPWQVLGTGNCGTGANMAFRKSIFSRVGGFDPALDVGTPSRGAGDLEMFFRVLKEGFDLLYEPAAIVRHRHRRDMESLRGQIRDNGSVFAYFRRSIRAYPDQRKQFVRLGCTWMCKHLVWQWIRALVRPMRFPARLRADEILGCWTGWFSYPASKKLAVSVAKQHGSSELGITPTVTGETAVEGYGVRCLELSGPIRWGDDLKNLRSVRIYALWKGSLLGYGDFICKGNPISVREIAVALIGSIGIGLFDPGRTMTDPQRLQQMLDELRRLFVPAKVSGAERLPDNVSVSIVVATYDRPDSLKRCIACILAQATRRRVQVVVADNHPVSGMTADAVAEFPDCTLVSEPRQGVAYARNAGFLACDGDIIVTTDDDVTMPPDWLEKLLAPFSRPDIMLVNGNILPEELETAPQRAFEGYGGLGRGFELKEFDPGWFERSGRQAVPTWNLGATANSAFRSCALHDPDIGYLEETLGPGMPSGVGEDIYLYYKVLKAGHTIRYAPDAYVWHTHRDSWQALRRQLYNYSKGFVCYHLTTLWRDRDFRSLSALLCHLPRYHGKRIWNWMRGRAIYPVSLTMAEIWGNFVGPLALLRSVRRVRRDGRITGKAPTATEFVSASNSPADEISGSMTS